MRIANYILMTALASVAICQTGCEKKPTNAKVTLDVYDPGSPGSVRPDGDWDASQVRVYLDGELLGTTPIEFTAARPQELNLPDYQRVDLGDNSHWITWDGDGHGHLEVAAPETPDSKRRIEFRSLDSDSDIRFSNLLTQTTGGDGIRLSIAIPRK